MTLREAYRLLPPSETLELKAAGPEIAELRREKERLSALYDAACERLRVRWNELTTSDPSATVSERSPEHERARTIVLDHHAWESERGAS